ncbi:MAG TPA: glycosyltransferase family 39 protein [Patescibacteria group bacterium]|nr:glycosyltransferase family 39 protein [Patescibacteria group bacterium]
MTKLIKNWFWQILILIGILIFAFVIRILHLTILPVFADEAIYIRWSQVMAAESTLRFLPLSDGKEPLYMWILMLLIRHFQDPLWIGRLESVICGIGTIVGIFASSYLLFKNKIISLLASFLWAIVPIAFFFDRMALVDSMLCMFGIWTFFFALLTAKFKRLDTAMLAGFCLGFAWLTKSPAIFFILLIPVTWLFAGNFKELLKLIGLTLVTYVIAFGMFNILRLGPNFELIASRNLDYVYPISHIWTNPRDPFTSYITEVFADWLIKMGPGIGLILAAIGIFRNYKKYWKEVAIIFAWFLIPLLVQSEYAKVLTVRYILFTVPFFIILISIAFLNTKKQLVKLITLTLLVVFIIQSLLFDKDLIVDPATANLPNSERSGYLEEWTAGQGIKEISFYLRSLPTAPQIVVGTEGFFGTLPDGLEMYLNNYPKVTVVGTGLNFTDVPEQLKAAFKAGDQTFFVVNTSRILIKPEDYQRLGLKLIASYPKAMIKEKDSDEYARFGPQEALLFFQIVEPNKK